MAVPLLFSGLEPDYKMSRALADGTVCWNLVGTFTSFGVVVSTVSSCTCGFPVNVREASENVIYNSQQERKGAT